MRCREVKRRLNDGSKLTEEMEQHLRECADCAAEAQGALSLGRAIESARGAESLPVTPMAMLRAKVARREQESCEKENIFMSILKQQFSRRPRFSTGLVIAVVAILFVTLVPFSYERTVSYEVSFEGVPGGSDYSQSVSEALAALGFDNASVSSSGHGNYVISNLPSRVEAKEAAAVFAGVTGTAIEPQINAVTETVSGSLYAQVRDGIIRIEVDAEGKSDAEIESEIMAQLAEHGFNDTQVQVTTKPDGERQMSIFIGDADAESGKETEQTIELKMGSGNSDQKMMFDVGGEMDDSEMDQLIKDNKDLSDSELETLIQSKFAEKGYPEVDVTVSTTADGKRDVQLKMDKQEWNTGE